MNYSQNGEQIAILEALERNPWDVTGPMRTFLDVGANDGQFASNTRFLAEMGWPGVLVEASYQAFGNLLKFHGGNEKLRLVQAAVGVDHRLTPFWEAGLVSTTNAENYMHWRGQVKFSEPYMLPQVTVNELITAFPAILDGGKLQVVSIDTEGSSVQLFDKWPWDRAKPYIFCVEYDSQREWLMQRADYLGYEVAYMSSENLVLVDKGEK